MAAKRSVTIAGHATSVSLEEAFWDELREIAQARGLSLNQLVEEIDASRASLQGDGAGNLSSAIRLFVLAAIKNAKAPGP